MGKRIKRKYLKYEEKKNQHNLQKYERIRSFGDNIYTGKINIGKNEMD